MSKLDDLIEILCPNGVNYKKIKEVYTRIKGTSITAGKMHEIENNEGDIKIFAGGRTSINAYEKDIPKANITRVPAVIVQSRGVIDFIYYDKPFTFKNEMWAYTADNEISIKFLYYVLKNNVEYFRDIASGMGSMPQISLSVTEDFVVPVPPIDIQCEIVNILDNFTLLSEELKAELKSREKQLAYYEDLLLNKREYDFVKLNDVCNICSGGTPSKSKSEYWENGTIKWLGSTVCKNKKFVDEVTGYITEKGLEKSSAKLMKEKTTLIAMVGATIGKVSFLNFEATTNQNIASLYPKNEKELDVNYLYYACKNLYPKFLELSNGKFAMASLSFIKSLEIPFPNIEKQKEIAKKLEKLDILCNDISNGLPAEIEARQKQYEYYRDKLLNFKELKEE